MKKIQHFVLTQFYLRMAEISEHMDSDKYGNKIEGEEWLEHRFGIFEEYCLPSLAAQINKDFLWLLFFDESTPQRFRERIDRAKISCPQIRTFYIRGTYIHDYVMEMVDSDTDILITTRIDNDDAFHADALKIVREQADTTDRDICVNFRYGLEVEGDTGIVISHKYNPFASLIESPKNGEYKTIFASAHGHIHTIAPVRQIVGKPYWLRVIHEKNITNRSGSDAEKPSMRNFKTFRRYLKNRVFIKLRRHLWPPELRRKYSMQEIQENFHIKSAPNRD